jgi:hypothetical protein
MLENGTAEMDWPLKRPAPDKIRFGVVLPDLGSPKMGQYVTLRSHGVKAAHEVSHEPHGETDEQGVAVRYMIADARMI